MTSNALLVNSAQECGAKVGFSPAIAIPVFAGY